jgi:hypothetical protein
LLGVRERRLEQPTLAHRICRAAQPGEVLVSRTVVDLVAGSGLSFDDTEEVGIRTGRDRRGLIVGRRLRSWRPGSVHRMRKSDPHTITWLHRTPTWTLMLVGPRAPEPSWGYWDETGWTPHDQHPHHDEFAAAQAARQGADQ